MSTQEPKPVTGEETDNKQNPDDTTSVQAANQQPTASSAAAAPSKTGADAGQQEDDEDARQGGDMDFGALLDQFEQEQAGFQEGEVVRGTVVDITERGVVIDFGYKSEGIVNQAEFTEDGKLTVKPGDEVEVLIKSMETNEGFPVLSRADAVRMKAWDELEKAYTDGSPIKGRIIERIKGGLRVMSTASQRFCRDHRLTSGPSATSTA